MNQPIEPTALAIGLLFVLRLGIPLALTALLAWLLRRLDQYWQSGALPPSTGLTNNQGNLLQPERSNAAYAEIVDRPCWEYRACPESKRRNCPAGCQTDVRCWLARLRNDGRLPSMCRTCPIFTTTSPLRASYDAAAD